MPHDYECEKAVLGFIIAFPYVFDEWRDYLTVNSFYDFNHQEIYKACCRVNERGDEINLISVVEELRKTRTGIEPYDVTTLRNDEINRPKDQYPKLLFDLEKRRGLCVIGLRTVQDARSMAKDYVDVAEMTIESTSNLFTDRGSAVLSMRDTIGQVYEQMKANAANANVTTGTPTGFRRIDEKGGLQASDFIVVGGESSNGKTSFALSVVANAAAAGASVAFYSMEMTAAQLTARLIAMRSGVPSNVILYGRPNEIELVSVDKAVAELADRAVFFDERSTSNIDTIINSIRMMKKRKGISGAVVDYLQILSVNSRVFNKEQQMGEASRRLKNLAKELGIWIVALSQLNRDKDNPEPNINRMRDSGQIAEAADVVILVYRPERYGKRYPGEFSSVKTEGTALIKVAKGRNIGTFNFVCGFDAACTRFYPLDDELPVAPPEDEFCPY